MSKVQDSIKSFEAQIFSLEKSISDLNETKRKLDEERIVVFEKGNNEHSGYQKQIDVAEKQLMLLQSICPILFDENSTDTEIQGEIHLPSLGDIRPFQFSTQETSVNEISDNLWDLLWQNQQSLNTSHSF